MTASVRGYWRGKKKIVLFFLARSPMFLKGTKRKIKRLFRGYGYRLTVVTKRGTLRTLRLELKTLFMLYVFSG